MTIICTGCGERLGAGREVMVRGDGSKFCATCGFLDKFMPGLLPLWLKWRDDRGDLGSHPEPWDDC